MGKYDHLSKEELIQRIERLEADLERLKQTIELAGNSPFYHKIFKEKGITPDSFQSLEDLQKLPFTTKDDLRNNYPFGLAAIPLQKCVRIHSSSWNFTRSLRSMVSISFCQYIIVFSIRVCLIHEIRLQMYLLFWIMPCFCVKILVMTF